MWLHLFNRQTYHRGQIITRLRQNGIDKIPATDFIVFSRGKSLNSQKEDKIILLRAALHPAYCL